MSQVLRPTETSTSAKISLRHSYLDKDSLRFFKFGNIEIESSYADIWRDGNLWLIEGELYNSDLSQLTQAKNFTDLKKKLSDIEGAFCICFYSAEDKKIYIVHDPMSSFFGYYSHKASELIYSNDLVDFAKTGHSLNSDWLKNYFKGIYSHLNSSVFNSVEQLGCGEVLEINTLTLGVSVSQYYQPIGFAQSCLEGQKISAKTAGAQYLDILKDNIQKVNRGTPVVTFSGGADSLSIAYSAKTGGIRPELFSYLPSKQNGEWESLAKAAELLEIEPRITHVSNSQLTNTLETYPILEPMDNDWIDHLIQYDFVVKPILNYDRDVTIFEGGGGDETTYHRCQHLLPFYFYFQESPYKFDRMRDYLKQFPKYPGPPESRKELRNFLMEEVTQVIDQSDLLNGTLKSLRPRDIYDFFVTYKADLATYLAHKTWFFHGVSEENRRRRQTGLQIFAPIKDRRIWKLFLSLERNDLFENMLSCKAKLGSLTRKHPFHYKKQDGFYEPNIEINEGQLEQLEAAASWVQEAGVFKPWYLEELMRSTRASRRIQMPQLRLLMFEKWRTRHMR